MSLRLKGLKITLISLIGVGIEYSSSSSASLGEAIFFIIISLILIEFERYFCSNFRAVKNCTILRKIFVIIYTQKSNEESYLKYVLEVP